MSTLSQITSPFLSSYLKYKVGDIDVSEKKATCGDCLCSKANRGSLPYYDPHLKCCTFQPFLPNFTVGGIFEDKSVSFEFKKILREKIRLREYALPLGIFVPVSYQVKFNERAPEDFGNRKDLLCSYYDNKNQQCGIWRHRGSVCTSYFCTSDRGDEGLKFWETLGEYLHICEMVLAQDCLVSMGIPHELIDLQLEYINCATGTAEELVTDSMTEELFKSYWKDWDAEIEKYYIGCAGYIQSLANQDLDQLLNEELFDLEESIKKLKKSL